MTKVSSTGASSTNDKTFFIPDSVPAETPGNFLPNEKLEGLAITKGSRATKSANFAWFRFKNSAYDNQKMFNLGNMKWLAQQISGAMAKAPGKKGHYVKLEKLRINWDGYKAEVA